MEDPLDTLPPLHTTPLHPRFGVEVHGVDLRRVTAEEGYPAIRRAFETHSLLLFRDQQLDDAAHLAFGALFGPIEDRSQGKDGPDPRISPVSNRKKEDATIAAEDDKLTMNLMANQLWHTDSTFLPVPALANILAARVLSSSGGEWTAQAKEKAAGYANDGKARASEAIAGLGKLVADNAGMIEDKVGPKYGDYARSAAQSMQDAAARLDAKDLDELAEDAKDFVRKSPGLAVGIAAVAGFMLARMLRGSRD